MIHDLQLMIETLETENERYISEIGDMRYNLTKTRNEKKIMEDNLDANTKFNEDRKNYRKNNNSRELEMTQVKEKLAIMESNYNRIKVNLEDAEKVSKEKSNQLKLAERDLNILLKEHKMLSNEASGYDMKINSILEELQLEMKRTSMFELKCSKLECDLEEERENGELKIGGLVSKNMTLKDEVERVNTELLHFS